MSLQLIASSLSINRYYRIIDCVVASVKSAFVIYLSAKIFLFSLSSCYIDRLRQLIYQLSSASLLYEYFILIHQQRVVFVFLRVEKSFTTRSS